MNSSQEIRVYISGIGDRDVEGVYYFSSQIVSMSEFSNRNVYQSSTFLTFFQLSVCSICSEGHDNRKQCDQTCLAYSCIFPLGVDQPNCVWLGLVSFLVDAPNESDSGGLWTCVHKMGSVGSDSQRDVSSTTVL